ncbi:MAG: hypothetical protein LC667_19875, partial [Thioalkalivibrio sp.]|nr:hypothetical protein [Thioalkalivibrio sp.]
MTNSSPPNRASASPGRTAPSGGERGHEKHHQEGGHQHEGTDQHEPPALDQQLVPDGEDRRT